MDMYVVVKLLEKGVITYEEYCRITEDNELCK